MEKIPIHLSERRLKSQVQLWLRFAKLQLNLCVCFSEATETLKKKKINSVGALHKQYKILCPVTQENSIRGYLCGSPPSFSLLTVGLAPSAPSVAGRCMPATGCAGLGAACTIWPVSPVSPVRGSCPPERSSAWWRDGCSAAATTTSCWTTSAGPQKTVL